MRVAPTLRATWRMTVLPPTAECLMMGRRVLLAMPAVLLVAATAMVTEAAMETAMVTAAPTQRIEFRRRVAHPVRPGQPGVLVCVVE